jgi:hypothetical protein
MIVSVVIPIVTVIMFDRLTASGAGDPGLGRYVLVNRSPIQIQTPSDGSVAQFQLLGAHRVWGQSL